MRNKFLKIADMAVLGAILLCVLFGVFQRPVNRGIWLMENVEALTSGETAYLKGRWRTVGCGSYNFSDWKTYCCPHQYYQNCPNRGNCNSTTIFGCD